MIVNNESQKDEFQPKYELSFDLPDVPAKPKLWKFEDTNPMSDENNLFKYSYSSIEMAMEMNGKKNQIYTDYNMGVRPNLVDRQ